MNHNLEQTDHQPLIPPDIPAQDTPSVLKEVDRGAALVPSQGFGDRPGQRRGAVWGASVVRTTVDRGSEEDPAGTVLPSAAETNLALESPAPTAAIPLPAGAEVNRDEDARENGNHTNGNHLGALTTGNATLTIDVNNNTEPPSQNRNSETQDTARRPPATERPPEAEGGSSGGGGDVPPDKPTVPEIPSEDPQDNTGNENAGDEKNAQTPHRLTEITHTPTHDVVANRTHPDQEQVDAVMQEIAGGIPHSWERVETIDPHREYYQDPEGKFFVKVKQGVSAAIYGEELRDIQLSDIPQEDKTKLIQGLQAGHSVLNEIKLGPEIQRILDTDEVRQLLAENGFEDGIRLVKPLGFLVEKESGRKIAAYPMQDGYRVSDTDSEGRPIATAHEAEAIDVIASELDEILTRHGIDAVDVTRDDHYIIKVNTETGRKQAFLVDTENFCRRQYSPESQEASGEEMRRTELQNSSGAPEDTPLRQGSIFHFKEDELHEGPDPAYSDPERPEVAYAAAGTFVVGRGGEEQEGLTFNGSSEGCRIITIWNEQTGEGALVHVGAEDIGTEIGEELIQRVADTAPTLLGQGARAHVFGDVETSPLGEAAGEWNESLATFLRNSGVDEVTIVSEGRGKDVYLDTTTGRVETFDATERRIYPLEAPSAPTQLPPEPTQGPEDARGAEPEVDQPNDSREDFEGKQNPESGVSPDTPQGQAYEFSVIQIISQIAPFGEQRLRDIAGEVEDIKRGYHGSLYTPGGKEKYGAPSDPRGKAELLESFLSPGQQGLEELAYMIQRRPSPIDDLQSTSSDDYLPRDLVRKQLRSVIGAIDERIRLIREDPREDLQQMAEGLEARRARLEETLAMLNEPKSF